MSSPEQESSPTSRWVSAAKRGLSAAKRRHSIERLGPLEDITIQLPASGVEVRVTKPTDVDALLDRAQEDPEEHLPYWAALWPSGIGLADAVLSDPDQVRGKPVLELGTGLGVTAIAAMRAGADLTITDYARESIELAQYNVAENGLPEPPGVQMNWRSPSAEFRRFAGDGFPIVLAADVLYELRDVEPLLELVDWLVAPDGHLWLAEPRRYSAERFVDLAQERGWTDDVEELAGPWPEMNDTGVIVRVHKLRRT